MARHHMTGSSGKGVMGVPGASMKKMGPMMQSDNDTDEMPMMNKASMSNMKAPVGKKKPCPPGKKC